MADLDLPFAQRAGFIAGPAKSGTTLLVSLLDNHPELLVFPTETAYFATVLTKFGPRGRRAQFDYLTRESFARVLFGAAPRPGKHRYEGFPTAEFRRRFEDAAFAPENAQTDLLVLMIELPCCCGPRYPAGSSEAMDREDAGRIEIIFRAILERFSERERFCSRCGILARSWRRRLRWSANGERGGFRFITSRNTGAWRRAWRRKSGARKFAPWFSCSYRRKAGAGSG